LAATSAFAQSTVEIYGIIDQSVATSKVTLKGNTFTVADKFKDSGVQSGLATQRLGFRGTEDLGNGTKALFQVENDLSAGGTGGFGSRPTFVGLTGGMGTLTLGRQDTPMLKAVVPQLAGGANNAVGQIMWSSFAYGINAGRTDVEAVTAATGGFGRIASQTTINKAINYKTPSFNGVTAELQVGKNSQKEDATGVAQAQNNTSDTGMNLQYANGPLTLNAASHKAKTETGLDTRTANQVALDAAVVAQGGTASYAAAKATTKNSYVGATYNLGFANLSLQHGTDKRTNELTGLQVYSNKGTQFGIQAPVTATVKVFASYGKGSRTIGRDDVAGSKLKQSSMQLGAAYSFSKRTTAYAVYGSQKLTGDNVLTEGLTLKQTQTVVGLNHSF
jgi:predicted porin